MIGPIVPVLWPFESLWGMSGVGRGGDRAREEDGDRGYEGVLLDEAIDDTSSSGG